MNSHELPATLHPITTLPDEIITEILIRCLPSYPDCPPISGPESPTNFLGVCRHWHAIALHSPDLWRGIRLSAHRGDDGSSTEIGYKQLDTMKSWLQRSGSCRLSLNLNFLRGGARPINSLTELHQAMFSAVVSERQRWEYVIFYIPPEHVYLLSGPAPALVKSTLVTNWRSERHVISFDNANLLRSVCFWNVAFGPNSLDWAQLTTLSFLNVRPAECIPALAAATNLLRCLLYCNSRMLQNDVHITLPCLETLVLAGHIPVTLDSEPCQWLSSLTLPALRNLQVSERQVGISGVSCIQSFIERSNCRLEHLRITCIENEELGLAAQCRIALPTIATVHNGVSEYETCSDAEDWQTEEYWVEEDRPNWVEVVVPDE